MEDTICNDTEPPTEPGTGPVTTSPEPGPAIPHDRRVERIADYVSEALDADDPLEANLGAVNADLMFMAYRLKQVVGDSLRESPETIRAMAEVMPAVDNYLKVTKQIGSMSQLVVKLRGLHGSS